MPDKPNYTAGYDRTDQDDGPAITFKTVFGANAPEGVTTPEAQTDRGYLYTDTGLLIDRELSDSDWRGMLPEIQAIHSAYQFIVGDWAVYGVDHGYEESYEAVAALTGFKASTVEFYASICRNIPRLVRTNRLTFGHYQRIAPLPESDRAYWITYAVEHEVSIRELREAIAAGQLPAEAGPGDNTTIAPAVEPNPPAPVEEEAEEITPLETVKEARKTANTFLRCVAENRLQDMSRGELYAFLQFVQSKYEQRRKMGE